MFHISERTHSGFIFMSELAARRADGGLVSLKEVARRRKLSEGYLEEVAAALRSAGLIQGRTGPRGGYILVRGADAITAKDIITALEGPIALAGCQITDAACPVSRGCSSKRLWGELQEKILAALQGITLAEIVG